MADENTKVSESSCPVRIQLEIHRILFLQIEIRARFGEFISESQCFHANETQRQQKAERDQNEVVSIPEAVGKS